MANEHVNKVIYGGETLIDLTGDTAVATDVLSGKKFHLKSGAQATGSCTYDADTSDATAAASEILATKTAYVNGSKVTGSMANRGGNNVTVTDKTGTTIPAGFYDGSGKAVIDSTSATNLVAQNIREGVTILSIEGTMSGSEDMHAQAKTATPATTQQVITPDSPDYNCLSQVTVAAIPVTRTDNAAGGVTCTIAGS
ncbi:MAG: hypothetical protein IKF14_10555 [Atopobiaceae bacterium]|nr:hypothetical protein [Atopobiaceae bacterium]